MYFLKSRLRLPQSLEVPRTGLEYLFMSKAFLRAYMSDRLREMDPLEKAILIPNLIVGNDHGAAEFAFNPIYLEPHEMVGFFTSIDTQWIALAKIPKLVEQFPLAFRAFEYIHITVERPYADNPPILATIHPRKLFALHMERTRDGA